MANGTSNTALIVDGTLCLTCRAISMTRGFFWARFLGLRRDQLDWRFDFFAKLDAIAADFAKITKNRQI
jgi:hypothetical protein